ncbi:hypothetical protein, partial [Rhizorhapis sp. SPR117]|uniref:hypothetical protein n=1 Tax=Rhizorhapis sp. SPR117 TaxID=2912611 RepID=UPI001F3333CB|nr:hypothetical protein [Rhizorhapis sp. SPR117]
LLGCFGHGAFSMTGRRETLSRLQARHEGPGLPLPLAPATGGRSSVFGVASPAVLLMHHGQ